MSKKSSISCGAKWKRRKRLLVFVSALPCLHLVIVLLTLSPVPLAKASNNDHVQTPVLESPETELLDEENDEKLFIDMLESLSQWRRMREAKERRHRVKRDEEMVCYGDLGCFRDHGPFDYLDMLPSPPEEVNTKLLLYTRTNSELAQFLDYNNASQIRESHFNASLPIKIIVHGFGSGCNRVWPREMRLSFLAVEDCNVICVNWSDGAIDPNYVRAAVNTRLVGKQVAIFVQTVNDVFATDVNLRTHIIGFSLGAHVAGFAGAELKNLSRITGLDPAGPLFEGYDPKVRLDQTDANYVDVIHSNGESLIVGGFGVWEPIGHVDFYPNGGRAQRGCQHLIIGGLYDFIYSYSSNNETYRYLCNHRRAYKLFTNSISPKCTFHAFPCESYERFEMGKCFSCSSKLGECGQLGYYSDQAPGRGSLYLLTREDEPFCGNQYKINVMFTSTRVPIHTYGRLQILLVDKDGLNETHPITADVDDLLTSGSQLEKLIVVHPAIVPVEAHILYVAYEGWIYSGRFQWSLDKLVLTDSYGEKKSYCHDKGKLLPSGLPIKLLLAEGDCIGGSANHQPDYPILPFQRYPKLPPGQVSAPPKKVFKPVVNNKLKSGAGQDVYYVANAVSESDETSQSVETFFHDQVAPVSVPEVHTFIGKNPEVPHDVGPAYHVDKLRPVVKPQRYHYHIKPNPKWNKPNHRPRVPVPQLSNGWNRPVNTINDKGQKVQFPARRRPSTSTITGPPRPVPPLSSHLVPPPPPSVPIEVEHHPTTAPLNNVTMVNTTLNATNGTTKLDFVDQPIKTNASSTMEMHMLTDDQLTIVKFGPDDDDDDEHDDTNSTLDTEDDDDDKREYIVLHKLPNGEALNLENLQTYNMADIASGKVEAQEDVHNFGMGDSPNDKPRSFNSFDVNEGNDKLDIESATEVDHNSEDEEEYVDDSDTEGEEAEYGFTLPPPDELVISEAPTEEPEIYSPKPLHELDDLEAMPSSNEESELAPLAPAIITKTGSKAKLKLSRENGASFNIHPHPYYVNFRDPEINPQAHIELLRLGTDSSRARKLDHVVTTMTPTLHVTSTTNHSLFVTPETTDGSGWIPIESTTSPPKPTYGPVNKPEGFVSSQSLAKLRDIADVSLPQVASIQESLAASAEVVPKPAEALAIPEDPVTKQILPRKLSSPNYRPGGGYAGQFRENKIAPIFKQEAQGLDRHHARGLRGGPGYPRVPRRILKPGGLHGPEPRPRYIPLVRRLLPRLWWQPTQYTRPTTIKSSPTSLVRDDLYVDNATFEAKDNKPVADSAPPAPLETLSEPNEADQGTPDLQESLTGTTTAPPGDLAT